MWPHRFTHRSTNTNIVQRTAPPHCWVPKENTLMTVKSMTLHEEAFLWIKYVLPPTRTSHQLTTFPVWPTFRRNGTSYSKDENPRCCPTPDVPREWNRSIQRVKFELSLCHGLGGSGFESRHKKCFLLQNVQTGSVPTESHTQWAPALFQV